MSSVSLAIIPYNPNISVLEQAEERVLRHAMSLEKAFLKYFSKSTILCVEVGHSRFTAANLTHPLTLKRLKNVKTQAGPSTTSLKQISLLFKYSKENPIFELARQSHDMISLSIFGPIFNHSRHINWAEDGRSKDLKNALEKEALCTVRVDGNAVSWAIGALEYIKFIGASLDFPALAITLGTAVGVALIENSNKVTAIEICAMNPLYPRLRTFVKTSSLDPRHLLEKKFIDDLSGGEKYTDKKMKLYCSTYNKHFRAFISDVCEEIEKRLSLPKKIASFLIGGECSRYIDPSKLPINNMLILSPKTFTEQGLSPDILPLLGCLRNGLRTDIGTNTYPSEPEMRRFLKGDIFSDLYNHQEVVRELFDIDGDIRFERLMGGTVSPVYIFRSEDNRNIPFGVFKQAKDISFAEKQMQVLTEMTNNGFEHAACILANKGGEYVTKLGKNSYYCMEYLEPDQKSSQWQISFEEMLELTSRFHFYSKKCAIPDDFQRDKLDECRRCVAYLSDIELKQWDPSLFEADEWEEIVQLGSYFASESFEKIYRHLPTQIIHGDIHRENLVVSKGRPFFIDFDTVRTDVRLLDFAIFSGWNCVDIYLKLLEENNLFTCVQTHYGELESIEKEHYHTIVLFVWINLLAWGLQMLKQYIADQDQEHINEYRDFLANTTKDIQKMLRVSLR